LETDFPVGFMIIGNHLKEGTIIQAANEVYKGDFDEI